MWRVITILVDLLFALYRWLYVRPRGTVTFKRVEVDRDIKQAERERDAVSVLVTGGNGILGSALIECLLKEGGYRVHSLDLWIPEEADRNPQVCSYIQADVTNLDDMTLALNGIDAVFHAAGLIPTVRSSDADYYRVNTGGTGNIVEACKSCGVKRLIYTSSVTAVIGNDPKQDLDGVDETTPYPETPLNAYCGSKAAAEKLVRQANGENGLVACVMRPAGLLGLGSPIFMPVVETGLPHIGDRKMLSNYFLVPVRAVARAEILAEKKLRSGPSSVAAGKVYNLCIDDKISYKDLCGYEPHAPLSIWGTPSSLPVPYWLALIGSYLNRLIYICTGRCPIGGAMNTPPNLSYCIHSIFIFSSALAHKELGWEELPPWREIVKGFVEEYRTSLKKER